MRTVQVLEAAADEAVEAATWYEAERLGLGHEFFHAIDAALELIADDLLPLNPIFGEAGLVGAKRLILKRFPYDIITVERSGTIFVVAIAHHSRRPGYWRGRISP